MIGICSELIKTLTSRKSIPINTTFLSQMLTDSMILNGDFVGLEQFVHAMQNTDGVKFDKCTKVYAGFQTSGESIYKVISGKHNIVLFFRFRDLAVNKSGPSRVGIYLRTGLDKIDLNSNDKVYVTDPKGTLALYHRLPKLHNLQPELPQSPTPEPNPILLHLNVQQLKQEAILPGTVAFRQIFHKLNPSCEDIE